VPKISRIAAMAIVSCVFVAGCGDRVSDGMDLSGYFPMAVGNYWKYQEVNEISGKEAEVVHEVTDFREENIDNGVGTREVFIYISTWSDVLGGGEDVVKLQYIEDDGDRVVRHYQEKTGGASGTEVNVFTYVPGLLKFDRTKNEMGMVWTEPLECYGCTTDGVSGQQREYTFEILNLHETITVPAGTFDCLVVKRWIADGVTEEEKIYYFAEGVGKVKELTDDTKVEELTEYDVSL
jgi:hypothetical protein